MIIMMIMFPPHPPFAPQETSLKNAEAIIRHGLQRYTDQVGMLWNSLAEYYIISALFERVSMDRWEGLVWLSVVSVDGRIKQIGTVHFLHQLSFSLTITQTTVTPLSLPQARDVYEEALRSVMTVRDFTQVFDSYAQFEELMLKRRMEEVGPEGDLQEETDIELRYLLLTSLSISFMSLKIYWLLRYQQFLSLRRK